MPRPIRSVSTEALWGQVPQYLRDLDEAAGWPLFNFISVWGEQFHDINDVILGISRTASSLADPTTINASWLAWLKTVIDYVAPAAEGKTVPVATQRTRMNTPARIRHGSALAIAAALQDLFAFATAVTITPFWRGDPWVIAIRSTLVQTPLTATYITTWDEFEDSYVTWDDFAADVTTWNGMATIDRIHLIVARCLGSEKPAGVRLAHVY